MVNRNYGKYPVPETLIKLIDLQKNLEQRGLLPYGDLLGLYFSLAEVDERYLNTPIDLISFARPGSDGIHLGFLTDFGLVEDLEDAYIVRVSPMDFDDPVKIVARNLSDFLKLLYSYPASFGALDMNSTEDDFKKFEEDAEEYPVSQEVRDIFRNEFTFRAYWGFTHLFPEFERGNERERLSLKLMRIGIVNAISGTGSHPIMEVSRDRDIKLELVEGFFKTATPEAKLRFLRDAQSFGLIFDDSNLKLYLREQLLLMNLNDEAVRIMYPED